MCAATRAGSCATRSDQPRQVRKEATVRQPSRVPQGHLAGAGGIGFAWAKGDDEGCTALQGGGGAAPARRGARWRRKWESRSTLSGTAPWTNYPSGPSGGTSVRIQKRERRWEISAASLGSLQSALLGTKARRTIPFLSILTVIISGFAWR